MELLYNYKNGNCDVNLYSDGTREIEWPDGEEKSPSVPFNMDVKITNFCDSTAGCMKHCHEKSNLKGKHSNLLELTSIFEELPFGIEIAIGGGNPLSHPDLLPFLGNLSNKNLVSNLTVNQFHYQEKYYPLITNILESNLIKGLGCSITSKDLTNITPIYDRGHLVFHLILGLHTLEDVLNIYNTFENPRILFLGYKTFGNGISYHSKYKTKVDENIWKWYSDIYKVAKLKDIVLIFDNLAITQLNLKRLFKTEDWNIFYQGEDEGLESASMYIDLEKEEFSFSSRNPKRFDIEKGMKVKDMFSYLKYYDES